MFLLLCLLTTFSAGSVSITIAEPSRRIVTDAGAGGYQAFPDVCRLKKGELLCVFYAGYGHVSHPRESLPKGGRICAVRSNDEGRTWSAPVTLIDSPDDDRDPSVTQLPNGTLLLNFFTYDANKAYDTCISRSLDGGRTWSEPEVVMPGYATSSPIRRLRSGRLLLPIYFANDQQKRSFAAVSLSNDQGKSWSSPRPIGLKARKTLDETDFYERNDGSILAVMRQVMTASESRDGGRTWSVPVDLGFPGHCPYLLMTRSGVLLMGHRVPQTSLHYSLDEGRTWRGPIMLDDFIGAYPSMVELKDGRILFVYYEEGANSAIRALTLSVERRKELNRGVME